MEHENIFDSDTARPLVAEANPVGRLKEYTQRRGRQREVEYVSITSPVGWGFAYKVLVDGFEVGMGYARNKKQAKHNAAMMGLSTLKAHPDLSSFVMPRMESLMSPVSRASARPMPKRPQLDRWKREALPPLDLYEGQHEPLQVDESTRWKADIFTTGKGKELMPSDNILAASLRKVTGFLNKITLETFKRLSAKLVGEITDAVSQAEDASVRNYIDSVVCAIVRKAQTDSHFSMLYASLCKTIATQGVSWSGVFLELLRECTQAEFKGKPAQLTALYEAWEGFHEEDRDEKSVFARKCFLGHVKLIGCLHVSGLLSEDDIFRCLRVLTSAARRQAGKQPHQCEPVALERQCMLLQTVGKFVYAHGDRRKLQGQVDALKSMLDADELQPRLKFMLENIIDLCQQRWEPRLV
eukprot:g3543.t1